MKGASRSEKTLNLWKRTLVSMSEGQERPFAEVGAEHSKTKNPAPPLTPDLSQLVFPTEQYVSVTRAAR
jgi:hypothetical protein